MRRWHIVRGAASLAALVVSMVLLAVVVVANPDRAVCEDCTGNTCFRGRGGDAPQCPNSASGCSCQFKDDTTGVGSCGRVTP